MLLFTFTNKNNIFLKFILHKTGSKIVLRPSAFPFSYQGKSKSVLVPDRHSVISLATVFTGVFCLWSLSHSIKACSAKAELESSTNQRSAGRNQ